MTEVKQWVVEKHQCEHEGCTKLDTVRCTLPEEKDVFYYCEEHCQIEGFCSGCGEFWGGNESFDFRANGLCDNCNDELEADIAENADMFQGDLE